MESLLGIAGATASGKDTLIDEVLLSLGFESIKTSTMLRRAIPAFYPDIHEDTSTMSPLRLNELGTGIREVHGQDFFTQLAIHEEIKGMQMVINGIRRGEEFDAVHKSNGLIVLIVSSVREALRRAVKVRQRGMDQGLDKTVLREHIRREKKELDELSPKADLVLINNFANRDEFIDFSRQRILEILK